QGSLAASTHGAILNAGQSDDIQLTLGASGGVVGRLGRADGGTVVRTNNVLILFGSQSSADGNAVELTGADGRFAFTNIPVGNITVQATALRVGGLARATGTLVSSGDMLDLGDVVLDEDLPRIVEVTPANSTSGVPVTSVIEITFHEPMDPATVNGNTNAIFL